MYERKAYDVTSDEAAADPARVRGARAAGAVPRGASDAGAAPGAGRDPAVLDVRQPRTWAAPFLHLPTLSGIAFVATVRRSLERRCPW